VTSSAGDIVPRGLAALRRVITAEVEDVNRIIYHTLRAGTIACAVLLVVALAYIAATGAPTPSRAVPVPDLLRGLGGLTPATVLSFGLLLLILTPVARVAFSVGYFAREKDATYVLVTLIVLVNLLAGFVLGIG
jgi:uncharacterized membrane protein